MIAGTSARLTEVVSEVTFEMIWNRYDYKVGKKEAMAKWSRMTRPEQWKAYNFVARYKSRKPDGQAQLYLASYLNKERWND